jgi:oligopeptide transport system permease protein
MKKNTEYNLSATGLSNEELFSMVDRNELESEKITAPRYSYWRSVFRVFFNNRLNVFILSLLGFVILMAYVYPAIFDFDQYANVLDPTSKHLTPTAAFERFGFSIHWLFGAGKSGEPTFDAIWFGSRVSISLALVCAGINMSVGVIVGAIWGFSKKVDAVMNEVMNIVGNIPGTLFLAVMVMILKANFWTLVFALTITNWIFVAYAIRTQVVIIRDREYNLASKCLGTSTFKITMKNILPFMTSYIVTLLASEIPSYINAEIFISIIGLGIKDITLGRLLYEAENAMMVKGWGWEFWSPVFVAAIISVVLYVAGQNLGDASDPRTHM